MCEMIKRFCISSGPENKNTLRGKKKFQEMQNIVLKMMAGIDEFVVKQE